MVVAAFVVGVAASLVMAMRSQAGGDQLNLLARGWLLAERGTWLQYGTTTSANGKNPGGLTTLLVGAPLMVWRDYRAPALLLLLGHVAAYLLLDRVVRRSLTPAERRLFAVLYWLNPWRVYHSAFVWSASWMFPFGAAHLATSYALRRGPRFVPSLLHALVIAAALQVHPAFVILAAASALLVWRGFVRPHWAGLAVGAALGALALVPWGLAMLHNPALLPGGKGFPLRGLVLVFPVVRGVLFWLRYPSLSYGGDMDEFDFSGVLSGPDTVLGPAVRYGLMAVGAASVLLSLWATVRLLRAAWRRRRQRPGSGTRGRVWLQGAVTWTFAGAVVAFALSPTTIMMWQGFAAFHAAVLPPVMLLGVLRRTRRARWAEPLSRSLAPAFVAVIVAMALGSPMYRRGGREPATIPVRTDHPMYHDLGVFAHTSVRVDPGSPWEPDVFRSDPSQGR